jgi:hypothetical protein
MEMKKISFHSFVAKDSSNSPYIIYVCAIHAVYGEGEPIGLVPPTGPEWLETSDGHRVAKIGEKQYKIINSDIVLTSDEPNAY